jgi:rubredoxin
MFDFCPLWGKKYFRFAGGKAEPGDGMANPEDMYRCQTVNCGYIYDPDRGDRKGKIAKGTRFEELPDTWRCPVCEASTKRFECMGTKKE